jgi:hypothetical protein
MACHIVFFYKSLRSLEEFRENPCVKIPPKSLCANFQRLGKFKNPIFILKRFLSASSPTGPAASRPIQPFWPTRPHRLPSSSFTVPARLFHRPPFPSSAHLARVHLCCIPQNTFSSLIRAFHPRSLLSLPSLMHGPCLLALSPTPHRPTPAAPPPNPAASDLPAPPSSAPRVAAFAH